MANGETLPEREEALITQGEQLIALLGMFIHGSKTTEVPTENGRIPSLAEIVYQWDELLRTISIDAAAVAGGVYSSVASGVAGSDVGETFLVRSLEDGQLALLWLNVDNTEQGATPVYETDGSTIKSIPTTALINSLFSSVADLENIGGVFRSSDGKVYGHFDRDGLWRLKALQSDSINGLGIVRHYIDEIATFTSFSDGFVFQITYPDGSVWPPVVSSLELPAKPVTVTTGTPDTIPDAIYNQWLYPHFEEYRGDIFGGYVCKGFDATPTLPKRLSQVRAVKLPNRGASQSVELAAVRIHEQYFNDDHNGPSVLLDARPQAQNPVTIFQADHNVGSLRAFPGNFDIAAPGPETVLPSGDAACYSQVHRNPTNLNEIVLFYRLGGAAIGQWWALRSLDNGLSWTRHLFITGKNGGTGAVYFMSRPALDSTGLWLAFHENPLAARSQDILLARFDWATGNITWPGTTQPWLNLWSSLGGDPYEAADRCIVFTPGSETARTRLYDVAEFEDGVVQTLTIHALSTNSSRIIHATTDATTGVSHVEDVLSGGAPCEIPAGTNLYYAGCCLVNRSSFLYARWTPTDAAAHRGTGLLGLATSTGGNWSFKTLVERTNKKILRPYNIRIQVGGGQTIPGSRFSYISGTYNGPRSYDTDIHIGDLNDY